MLRRVVATSATVALTLAGCASQTTDARIARFETNARADDQAIESLSDRIAAFEREVDEVVGLYDRASVEREAARERYERVTHLADDAGRLHEQAARDYEEAARNWRLVTISLLLAASWDYAGHLCGTRMTTGEYRKQLKADGIDLEGLDADHGLPKSMGGADHPLNYRMIDSSLNRSLGNDVFRKLLEHPAHLLQGAAVSALMRLRCSPQL